MRRSFGSSAGSGWRGSTSTGRPFTRPSLPGHGLHLWGMEPLDAAAPAGARFRRASDLGFYSLLHLAAARPEGPLALTVAATGLHEVVGGEALSPEKAPLIPICRVLA